MLVAKKRAAQSFSPGRQNVQRAVAARRQHSLRLAEQKVKMISFMLAFALTALALVAHFTYLVEMNHRIGRSMEELHALQDEGKHLKLEMASLQSPERLEKVALEMGLKYPGQEQMVILTAVATGN
ncbi:MAG: cell division protein FtsL [Dethiobacter sp.]|nr:cell division protein FtsL [Dethiobacter sp.]MBS3900765.1 cell division protein FtsL [Dethiobacter sp.]MBS3988724.1 cell division protein FtsL [Dethiobacter sp.]